MPMALLQLQAPLQLQGFLGKLGSKGYRPLLEVFKTFHLSPPLSMWAAQMPVQPPSQMYLIDMFISPHVTVPGSVIPELYLPLALRHIGPDSKCHVTSPHGIKALLRVENTNRWLKCLQQDSPNSPGDAEPCPWWWVGAYVQQKCQGEEQSVYPPSPQKACYSAGCQLPLQRTICYWRISINPPGH